MTYNEKNDFLNWLCHIIQTRGPITLKEINALWVKKFESYGLEISRSKFKRCKDDLQYSLGVEIGCDSRGRYVFKEESKNSNKAFMNQILVRQNESQFFRSFQELGSLIQIPSIPTDGKKLMDIGEALLNRRFIRIVYQKYTDQVPYTAEIEPYCIKYFRRRWYLVGEKNSEGFVKVFSFDRMLSIEVLEKKFIHTILFDPEEHFKNYYGVYVGDIKPEQVIIRTSELAMKYLMGLELHHSQKLVFDQEALSLIKDIGLNYTKHEYLKYYFMYHIGPTPDFENVILSMGQGCEVLSPLWLRDKIKSRLLDAYKYYI